MAPHRPARAALIPLCIIAFGALLASLGLLLSTPAASLAQAAGLRHDVRHVHAGSSDPTITWDSSMIFPGQNSGNPWGPVGEHAQVQGSNFPDGVYDLVLAAGDVNSDATVCSSSRR